MSVKSEIQFMQFVKDNHPELFHAALDKAGAGQLGEAEPEKKEGLFSRFTSALIDLAPTYVALDQQRRMIKINEARASQGLPPLSNAGVVSPTVKVDLPPDVVQTVSKEAGANVNKILMFAGIGLAAFLLMRNA